MKLFTASILFYFGIFAASDSSAVNQILNGYIEWTQTGKTCLGTKIFKARVDLTYQVGDGKFESTPFPDYRGKVESAATSVPRSMAVTQCRISGNKATAYVTDVSVEGDFSLVHRLSLRKKKDAWRIDAITIMDGP